MTNNNASALPTPSDLDECAAMTVADALKIILANSYAIYLKTKNFHWHVSGPYFRDYHLLLDEQAAEILAVTDAIAERARKTGNTTIRSIGDIARHQTIFDRHMGGAASPKQVRRIQHQQPQVPDWNAPHESGGEPRFGGNRWRDQTHHQPCSNRAVA